MAVTIPSDAHNTGDAGHTADHNNLADLAALALGVSVKNTAYSGGAAGDGVADDTIAVQAALNAATAGLNVSMPAGVYKVSSPLTIPPGVTLTGPSRTLAVPAGSYGLGGVPLQGAIIQPSAGFTGTQVIFLASSAVSQYGNQALHRITIDGSLLPAGTVHGIAADATAGVTLNEVLVYRVSGDGLHGAGAAGTGNHPPDFWEVKASKFTGCGGAGVNVSALADTWWLDTECTANTGHGWAVSNCTNSRFTACKAEASTAGCGWQFTAAPGFTGKLVLTGCSSSANFQDGFQFTGAGTGVYRLAGCEADGDGVNGGGGGGGFAGLRMTSAASLVVVTGWHGRNGTSSPQYGVSKDSSGTLALDGACALAGTTAPLSNSGPAAALVLGRSIAYGPPSGTLTVTPAYDPWSAADSGYAAQAFDHVFQSSAGTTRLITAGTLNLIGLLLRAPWTVSKVDLTLAGNGATLTAAQNLVGLYSGAGTLLGSSADQTTAWGAGAVKVIATAITVAGGQSLTLMPGLYWVALLGNGSTMPSFSAANATPATSAVIMNGRATAAGSRYATSGAGLTALPSSFTPSASTQQQVQSWWAAIY